MDDLKTDGVKELPKPEKDKPFPLSNAKSSASKKEGEQENLLNKDKKEEDKKDD